MDKKVKIYKRVWLGFVDPENFMRNYMKNFAIIILLIFFLNSCRQSITHDPKIDEFISKNKEYVQLSDSDNLPEKIKPYQENMINYLSKLGMESEDCYLWTSYWEIDSNELEVPIRHYDGFVKEYEFEQEKAQMEKNRDSTEEGYLLMIHKGNWSGKDGNLVINVSDGRITSYLLWR